MTLATFGMSAQNDHSVKREQQKQIKSNLTSEQGVDLRLKRMTTILDLNADQQEKIKQLLLENGKDKTGMYKKGTDMTDAQKDQAKKIMTDRRVVLKIE